VINGEGAGIAIRKGETELRAMFNEAIAAIRANGTYKEINDKYLTSTSTAAKPRGLSQR
jgi:polar amino acid transport system substrate-binding protein